MLPENSISRVIEYYLSNKKFADDALKAFNEFFGEQKLKPSLEEGAMAKFTEWFIYDFKLSNGKTPIEDYYEHNPYNISIINLQLYKELQDNVYSLFEIKKIDIGKGMNLLNIRNNKSYYVNEYAATLEAKEGLLLFGRLCFVNGHYELIGSDAYTFSAEMKDDLVKAFKGARLKITPKEIYQSFK